MNAGNYTFGADGKMVVPEPEPEKNDDEKSHYGRMTSK